MIRYQIEKAMERYTDEELGKAIREYIKEANHSSWDGWSGHPKREMRGMLQQLRDMTYWLEAYKD